ncbi:unnamed protein product, partial [Adineta ricciae]
MIRNSLLLRKNVKTIYNVLLSSALNTNSCKLNSNFDCVSTAYGYKNKWELFRGWMLYKMFSYNIFVDHLPQLITLSNQMLNRTLFQSIMNMTLYGHFIGGENKNQLQLQVEKLRKHRVKVILDHYMESDLNGVCKETINSLPSGEASFSKIYHPDEVAFDKNMLKYLKNIQTTHLLCGSKSFTAIKLTPLIRPSLLEKLNVFCCLHIEKRQFDDLLQLILHDHNFTSNEIGEINNLILRLNEIVKSTKANDMRIFIDAEQSYFQTAINKIVIHLQSIFNRENLFVYNTYQCYRRDTVDVLAADLEQSEREKFHIGFKLVRGGYMVQERKRALEMDYEDPIHDDFDQTSECYRKAFLKGIDFALRTNQITRIFVASHNEDTVRFAIET